MESHLVVGQSLVACLSCKFLNPEHSDLVAEKSYSAVGSISSFSSCHGLIFAELSQTLGTY